MLVRKFDGDISSSDSTLLRYAALLSYSPRFFFNQIQA